MDSIDILTNQVMYRVGETIVVIGVFITLVGLVTMIYSWSPDVHKNIVGLDV